MKCTLSFTLCVLMLLSLFSGLNVGAQDVVERSASEAEVYSAGDLAVADGDIDKIPQSADADSSLYQREPSEFAESCGNPQSPAATAPLGKGASELAETGASYNLWVGATQVTDANKGDILGDGTAQFDSSSNTLTLNDPTIEGEDPYYEAKICSTGFDLTIRGSWAMTDFEAENGIYVWGGSLTMDGSFTVLAKQYVAEVMENITFTGGSFTLKSSKGKYALNAEKVILGDNIERFEAETASNTMGANVISDKLEVSNKLKLTEPENGSVGTDGVWAGGKRVKRFVFEIADPSDISYGVWVGSTEVTAANNYDILGDGGSAMYNPAMEVLKLNKPNIEGVHIADGRTYKIYSEHDLHVWGQYFMDEYEADYGLYCYRRLWLNGYFTFLGDLYGVYSLHDLAITGGSVVGKSASTTAVNSAGICSYQGGIEIRDEASSVTAEGKKTYAIYGSRGISIGETRDVTEPAKFSISNGTVNDTSGLSPVVAKRVYIGKPTFYYLWLGSTQVNSKNKNDILGDGGKAKFDPETEVLTLDYPDVEGLHQESRLNLECNIYAYGIDLTVKGGYNFSDTDGPVTGIAVENANLTIDGNFSIWTSGAAIWSDRTVYFVSGRGYYRSDSGPALVCQVIYVRGGIEKINFVNNAGDEAKYKSALYVEHFITSGNVLVTTPENVQFIDNQFYEADGETPARQVIFRNRETQNTIDFAEISVHKPAAGKLAAFYAWVPNDANYEVYTDFNDYNFINGIYWYEEDTETYLTPGRDVFKAGYTYYVDVIIVPRDGYKMDTDLDGEIDGVEYYGLGGVDDGYAFLKGKYTVPDAAKDGELWLGDVKVTEMNRDDILGDGKASFDPETGTLTLDEPEIKTICNTGTNYGNCKIFARGFDLTVKGSYHMYSNMDIATGIGVIDGSLRLAGDFRFTGDVGDGVRSDTAIYVDSGELVAVSRQANALFCYYGTITIGSGIKKVSLYSYAKENGRSGSALYAGQFVMGDGVEVTSPEDALIFDHGVYTDDPEHMSYSGASRVTFENKSGPSGYTVSGDITSYKTTDGASDNVTVTMTGGGWTFSDDKFTTSYSFKNVPAGTYTLKVDKANHVIREYEVTVSGNTAFDVKICPIGDVNGDGKVTNFDYSKVNQHVCKVAGKELTDYAFDCADVNKDGKVTNFDAGKINQHVCKVKSLWS